MSDRFYITTTAPYVNAEPHIGFALEIVQADVIARLKRLQGQRVAFGFGTDEHGVKIYRKALESKKNPQEYCDEYAKKYDKLIKTLNLSTTHFIRTTDPHHINASVEFWNRCLKNGDIYKKNYRIKYCVGCELEKTDSELENNLCPIHPNLKIEIYKENNYFFRFSKYQKPLLTLYKNNPQFVLPKHRLKEIVSFVQNGLQDFSISRLKKKMPWGIDVPGDSDHVMYVWFDALIFYISTLGWPKNQPEFTKWWPGVQIAGKDNLRQQTAIWQAMLMSAGLANSKQVLIHGFITANGQKMSKSLGNVVDPVKMVDKYGADALRYYLLREIPTFEDGDFSDRRFKELINADLANGLGNLISRVTNLCEKQEIIYNDQPESTIALPDSLKKSGFLEDMNRYEFNFALEKLWRDFKMIDIQINQDEPWKNPNGQKLKLYLKEIRKRTKYLKPFLPETAEKILTATEGKIQKIAPLFPRI